jgi:hypothetical protein
LTIHYQSVDKCFEKLLNGKMSGQQKKEESQLFLAGKLFSTTFGFFCALAAFDKKPQQFLATVVTIFK